MRRFIDRLADFRNEIKGAIIEELKSANLNEFEFPQEDDRCDRIWQTCYNKNGEPDEAYVTKVELYGIGELKIYAESDYGAYTTCTSCDFEAKRIDFLEDLYCNIKWHLDNKN